LPSLRLLHMHSRTTIIITGIITITTTTIAITL
jgi:hypothetical protein